MQFALLDIWNRCKIYLQEGRGRGKREKGYKEIEGEREG
jgi:hypothetical protein